MESIGAFEAKTHLSSLLERVAKGERFTITRHGAPVAHLIPAEQQDPAKTAAVIKRMQDIAAGLTLGGDWKGFRDAGRKW
jgi:prevent-host-death family protein